MEKKGSLIIKFHNQKSIKKSFENKLLQNKTSLHKTIETSKITYSEEDRNGEVCHNFGCFC